MKCSRKCNGNVTLSSMTMKWYYIVIWYAKNILLLGKATFSLIDMKYFHHITTNYWMFLQLFQPLILYPFLGTFRSFSGITRLSISSSSLVISLLYIEFCVFQGAALYIIELEMVLELRRFRCQIAIILEVLNYSTALPNTGTGKISLATLDKSGYSRPY